MLFMCLATVALIILTSSKEAKSRYDDEGDAAVFAQSPGKADDAEAAPDAVAAGVDAMIDDFLKDEMAVSVHDELAERTSESL